MKKAKWIAMILVVVSIILCAIGCAKETVPPHEHTFATEWTKNETHHWYAATCEHTSEVSGKAEHTFGEWEVVTEATEETKGSKERSCSVCGCKETTEIEKLAHTHKFATDWSYDGAYHWKAATCEHTSEISEKAAHTFENEVCTVCTLFIPDGFVLIKAGTFQMGSTAGDLDEKPVHAVTLTKDFYMSKYEVTQGEYEQYCTYGDLSPWSEYGVGDNYPAYFISWYDALVYCNKRSIDEGLTPCYSISNSTNPNDWGIVPTSSDSTWNAVVCDWNANGYRLPTEAEWEYAARAGNNTTSSTIYSGTSSSSSLGSYAWYSSSKTHEVGTKKPNAFGLYDMSGNVWELCWNWYTSSYNTTTEGGNDPTGALSGSYRVGRGGSWKLNSGFCSVSSRNNVNPISCYCNLGFRVVRASSK